MFFMMPLVREVCSTAPWRSEHLSNADCIFRIMRSRGVVNPLLTAPWVTTKIFRMDWLHVSDLGVTADFIGNFFHEVLDMFPGNNKKERSASLFQEMMEFYNAQGTLDRFDVMLPIFLSQGINLTSSEALQLRSGLWCHLSGS